MKPQVKRTEKFIIISGCYYNFLQVSSVAAFPTGVQQAQPDGLMQGSLTIPLIL